MKNIAYVLVLTGFLLIWASLFDSPMESPAEATVVGPPKVMAELELGQTLELYFYACDMVQAKFPEKADEHCPVAPIVLFTTLPEKRHGEYDTGSRIVWMNDLFTHQHELSTFGEGVVVHEMVHYILWDYDLLQEDKEYCREEDLAWASADRWVESRGRPEDMNPEWWTWYERCDNATDDPRSVIKQVIGFIIEKTKP